jgi:tetratricopeptide (TPR) repeat protein
MSLSTAAIVFAALQTLVKEYSYQASELDSKITCRAIALEQVKRELLEELGTYVESSTIVRDYQIEKDEIRTLTAGVVQTRVLDEKWDGREYWLKAQVSADPDEVASSISKVRTDQKLAEELAESEAQKEAALKEVDRLKTELAKSNADRENVEKYNQAVNQLKASDSFEQGTALTVAGNYEEAVKAYDRSIDLSPNDSKAYFHRSIVYIYLGNYHRATSDLNRAMTIQPANTNIYYQRAAAYKDIRERRPLTKSQRPGYSAVQPHHPPAPRNDPLQRFLEKKRIENNLVRTNPFQPRNAVKRTSKPFSARPAVKSNGQPTGRPVHPELIRKGDPSLKTGVRQDERQRDLRRHDLRHEQRKKIEQQRLEEAQRNKQKKIKEQAIVPKHKEKEKKKTLKEIEEEKKRKKQ